MEGLKVRALWDPQINKAMTFLPEALALENLKPGDTPNSNPKTNVAQR